jgi:hypothetical protein
MSIIWKGNVVTDTRVEWLLDIATSPSAKTSETHFLSASENPTTQL